MEGENFILQDCMQQPGRSESIESTLAEKISKILEGELSSKEMLAHKTLHILNQKDMELSTLTERIRLLEALSTKQLAAEDLPSICNGSPTNSCQNQQFNPCMEEYYSTDQSIDADEKQNDTTKDGRTQNTPNLNSRLIHQALNEYINAEGLNTDLISAISNNSVLQEDHKNVFMKIISQLSEIVQSLKENKGAHVNGYIEKDLFNENGHQPETKSNFQRNLEESTRILAETQQMPDWEQVLKKTVSCNSLLSESDSFNSLGSKCPSKKLDCLNPNIKKHINCNKVVGNKLKKLYSKLNKHDQFISKTKSIYKELQEQGNHLVSMVDELKNEQKKEKDLTESLLHKIERISDSENWMQCQALALNHLEEQLSHLQQNLSENKLSCSKHEEEIKMLKEELSRANQLKNDLIQKNMEMKAEFSELAAMVTEERAKIDSLTEAVKKERVLNETMKQSYEVQLSSLVSNRAAEQKQFYLENKKMFETQIRNLHLENSELKARNKQLEDDSEKMLIEFKAKSSRNKNFFQSQVSLASQKLMFADQKIKEFFLAVEKLLRGLHRHLFENDLEIIKKKCHEEDSVQAATTILGVSPSEMSKVLAAGSLPNLADWLDICKKLVYKEKFADELASFIISIIRTEILRNSNRGAGDAF